MAQTRSGGKRTAALLFAAGILAYGGSASAQETVGQPTAQGAIQVETHFSKWAYPTEITLPPGMVLHIVEKGDTFWDLGQRYLGNPFAWPQIWDHNKWVDDPHWIYPGDPLLVPGQTAALPQVGAEPEEDIAYLLPEERPTTRSFAPPRRVSYVYAFHDFLQLPYLTPDGAEAHFKGLGAVGVTGCQKEDRNNLSGGDVVYLGGGADKGLQVGDRMLVLNVAATKLMHPDSVSGHRPLGDVIQHVAVLRLLSVHQTNAEAVIESTLDAVEVGQHAILYEEPVLIQYNDAPLRQDILEPIPLKTTAKIIYGRNGAKFFSSGSLVLIDRGASSGLAVGDVLISVRGKDLARGSRPSETDRTNRYLGQLLVVKVEADSATCLVIFTKSEMTLGDVVTD